MLTQEAKKRPVPLPDHYVLDGEHRLPMENSGQYAKYLAYRDLGPERSLNKVAKMMGRKVYGRGAANSGYYSALAARFRWAERVAAWDGQMVVEARRAAQALLLDQMKDEIKRRQTYLDNEWAVVERGFDILREMLKCPVVEKESVKTSPDGRTVVTVWKPGKWTYASVAQLIEAITMIGRLHVGLSTSYTAATVETPCDGKPDKPTMTPDEQAAHEQAARMAENT